ncbi:hypothetical protein [Leptospira interrogans]
MPLGVEHRGFGFSPLEACILNITLMPLGVEHLQNTMLPGVAGT